MQNRLHLLPRFTEVALVVSYQWTQRFRMARTYEKETDRGKMQFETVKKAASAVAGRSISVGVAVSEFGFRL